MMNWFKRLKKALRFWDSEVEVTNIPFEDWYRPLDPYGSHTFVLPKGLETYTTASSLGTNALDELRDYSGKPISAYFSEDVDSDTVWISVYLKDSEYSGFCSKVHSFGGEPYDE